MSETIDPSSKIIKREITKEDEYYARQEKELIEKSRLEKEAKDKQAQEQAARAAARGRCPHCGAVLKKEHFKGLEIEQCPEDNGLWLDKKDLETLISHHEGMLKKIFHKFKG